MEFGFGKGLGLLRCATFANIGRAADRTRVEPLDERGRSSEESKPREPMVAARRPPGDRIK
ncbi:hypothetical protein LCM4579_02865 [Ensifer sp. LCM 4579]|nr:hypothetical protein LCM4579_02865 [Ensifer sp. LCM 4579]